MSRIVWCFDRYTYYTSLSLEFSWVFSDRQGFISYINIGRFTQAWIPNWKLVFLLQSCLSCCKFFSELIPNCVMPSLSEQRSNFLDGIPAQIYEIWRNEGSISFLSYTIKQCIIASRVSRLSCVISRNISSVALVERQSGIIIITSITIEITFVSTKRQL